MTEARPAVPLWRKISQTLSSEIGAEGLQPGAKLPTEAQLAARFDVNRHTVRRAIDALVRTGMVRVEQGRGSFVAENVLDYAVSSRVRFSEWIKKHNKEPSGQALRIQEVPATRPVASGLGVEPGSMVALYERLGMADGVPVSLARHYFPSARLPGILAALRASETITEALRTVGVPDYLRQVTRVSARMPTAHESGLLQVSRVRPLLVCENVNVDRAGKVVEFGIARYPSTRVQVVFEP